MDIREGGTAKKYKGILMASLTAILGIALVGVGIAGKICFWTDWLTSVLLNIGSGLLATSITYFLVLPQMKYQEQEQFRELYEGQGVRDISFSPNQLFSAFEEKVPAQSLDIITDRTADILEIVNNDDLWKRKNHGKNGITIRILLKQPSAKYRNDEEYVSAINQLKIRTRNYSDHIALRFYNNGDLLYYCKKDNEITIADAVEESQNGRRLFTKYLLGRNVGDKYSSYFEKIWTGDISSLVISKSTFGRSIIYQEETIKKVLEIITEECRQVVSLKNSIEAVIVLWSEKKKKRETFYSCNKPPDGNKHNIWEYDRGVVGCLQKEVEKKGTTTADCVIFYNSESDKNHYRIMRFDRDQAITEGKTEEQTWDNADTKAMLAIPFLSPDSQMIGALTYDFAESFEDIGDDMLKKILYNAQHCRDIVNLLLGTNMVSNHEKYMIALEQEEND